MANACFAVEAYKEEFKHLSEQQQAIVSDLRETRSAHYTQEGQRNMLSGRSQEPFCVLKIRPQDSCFLRLLSLLSELLSRLHAWTCSSV